MTDQEKDTAISNLSENIPCAWVLKEVFHKLFFTENIDPCQRWRENLHGKIGVCPRKRTLTIAQRNAFINQLPSVGQLG